MKAEPQEQHRWLQRLVGEWAYEHEACMAPGEPAQKFTGVETVRSIGGLWTVGESRGEMPGGGAAVMIMTLGFDPARGRFVGTFLGSMMTHLWLYEGTLDGAGRTLTLETEGPNFGPGGGTAPYKDVIEFKSDDHRTLTSIMRQPDGSWQTFMTAHYRRK
ncbi:MAG TPA: DUF1579 domain-containing protein [Phycisphaerales bacterium]|nr:DUF1579 domain-containing protein [Phycisphaerales bacterium]